MAVYFKDNLLEEARKIPIDKVLAYYNLYPNQYNNYSCMAHKDTNPSAFITSANRLRCNSCEASYSTIDIVRHFEGLDARQSAGRIIEISASNIEINQIQTKADFKPRKANQKNQHIRKLSYEDRYDISCNKNVDKFTSYLISRGISPKVLPILDANNIGYGADKLEQIHLFFKMQKFCIYRSRTLNKNINCFGTEPTPTVIKVNDSYFWYITEGIFDALTLVDLNINVICLHGAGNTEKLFKMLEHDIWKKVVFVIATDNDTAGLKAKDTIIEHLQTKAMFYKECKRLYNSRYKDINQLVNNTSQAGN